MMEAAGPSLSVWLHRIHVLHALAQCVGPTDVVHQIEHADGKFENEDEILRMERRVFARVVELTAANKWPPKLGK